MLFAKPTGRKRLVVPAAIVLFLLLHVISVTGTATAGQTADTGRLGLSCRQILAMKPEAWADRVNSKNPGGEVGYDQAYATYAGCMRERNEPALKRLPKSEAERVRKYRDLCGKFRENELSLQQAYAGGGTAYSHAAARGVVEDEALAERLTSLYSGHKQKRAAEGRLTLARIRDRIAVQRPTVKANVKRLAEFSMGEQASEAYRSLNASLSRLGALLGVERPGVRRAVLHFLDEQSRGFNL